MDLIYMNDRKEDIGILQNYKLDLAFGDDENDFNLTVNTNSHVCAAGNIIYIDGTEYGGVIDKIRVKTANNELVYMGATWHGILENKVIEPNVGEDYLIMNGEANACLAALITRIGLGNLFKASLEKSDVTISNYKMYRYVKGYTGIRKMLADAGGKLDISFQSGRVGSDNFVILSASMAVDYSKDDEFDSSQIDFDIEKNYKCTNHIICLGKGDLHERQVIHVFADNAGNISEVQSQFGLQEVTDVYENVNVESINELRQGGIDMLLEAWNTDELQIDLDSEANYGIGDVVGAVENTTGIRMAKEITKKIVTINKGITKVSYKVGE